MEDKKKLLIQIKLLIAVGCVVLLFVTVFLIKDTYLVTKYRLFMKSTINNILNTSERYENIEGRIVGSEDFAKIEKEVPFKIETPAWLPDGYNLEFVESVEFERSEYSIKQKYIKKDDEYISVDITTFFGTIDTRGIVGEYREIKINDFDVILQEHEPTCSVSYINHQGFLISIGGTVTADEIIKIVENMG